MSKESQQKISKEKFIPIPGKRKNIRSIRQLYKIHNILQECSSDEDIVMYYLVDWTERNINISCSMIIRQLQWNKMKLSRALKKLEEKRLVDKIHYCHHCGKQYTRIPDICKNPKCSKILIKQQTTEKCRLRYPHYMIKLTEKGIGYVNKRLTDFQNALRILGLRISNLRQKKIHIPKKLARKEL